MSHTAITTPGTLRLLLARTTPGPQRSRAESRRLLLARAYSWPVTPGYIIKLSKIANTNVKQIVVINGMQSNVKLNTFKKKSKIDHKINNYQDRMKL